MFGDAKARVAEVTELESVLQASTVDGEYGEGARVSGIESV